MENIHAQNMMMQYANTHFKLKQENYSISKHTKTFVFLTF